MPTLTGICPYCFKEFFQDKAFENHRKDDYSMCSRRSEAPRGATSSQLTAAPTTCTIARATPAVEAGITVAPVTFPDPRYQGAVPVEVIAFYFPDTLAPCDMLCKKPFLGNFYDLGEAGLELKGKRFRTAEAAFQALSKKAPMNINY
eukprot:2589451-Amphidinium_carterae.1